MRHAGRFKDKIYAEYHIAKKKFWTRRESRGRGSPFDEIDRANWDELRAAEQRCATKWKEFSEWVLVRFEFGLSKSILARILQIPNASMNGLLLTIKHEQKQKHRLKIESGWVPSTPEECLKFEIQIEEGRRHAG